MIKNRQLSSLFCQLSDLFRLLQILKGGGKKKPLPVRLKENNGGIPVSPSKKAYAIAHKLLEAHNFGANTQNPYEVMKSKCSQAVGDMKAPARTTS